MRLLKLGGVNMISKENSYFFCTKVTYRNSETAAGNLQTGRLGPLYVEDPEGYEKAYEKYCADILDLEDLKRKITENEKVVRKNFSGNNQNLYIRHQPGSLIHNWSYFSFVEEPEYLKFKDYTYEGSAYIFFSPKKTQLELNSSGEWLIKLLSTGGKVLKELKLAVIDNKADFNIVELLKKYILPAEYCEMVCNGVKAEDLLKYKGLGQYIIKIDGKKAVKSDTIQDLFK